MLKMIGKLHTITRIGYTILIILTVQLFFTAAALAATALTIQVESAGGVSKVAEFDLAELAAIPQAQINYSSLDASFAPMIITAEGLTVETLLQELSIPVADVTHLRLRSADGWQRSFAAADYLHTDRYYYAQIVAGYITDSDQPPEFTDGVEQTKQAVPPLFSLRDYEGRYETAPNTGAMSSSVGMRFCVGQINITDTVILNYGKEINTITFVLDSGTSYIPPEGSSEPDNVAADDASATRPAASLPEKIDNEGLVADSLTITVGYYGGDYYTKASYSVADLAAMDQVRQAYTYLDNMPSVVLDSVVGVRLSDILTASGIDVNSIQAFHFYCADVSHTWYQSMNKDFLFDILRYYYPHLPERWDYEEEVALPGATAEAVAVQTIIALQDNWRRFATEPDFDTLTSSTRFRLIFGMTDVESRNAYRSAKWVHTISVTLYGAPPAGITLDASVLDLEIGSEYQLQAQLEITDQATDQRVEWSSSNPEIVKVDKYGKVKALAEGEAVITATTVVGGLEASVLVNGASDGRTGQNYAAAITETDIQVSSEAAVLAEEQVSSGVYEIVSETGADSGNTVFTMKSARVYEMSESAIALPDIERAPNPLEKPTVATAIMFLGVGVLTQSVYYRKQIR